MVYMPHWPKPLGFRPSDMALDRVVKLLDNLGVLKKNYLQLYMLLELMVKVLL